MDGARTTDDEVNVTDAAASPDLTSFRWSGRRANSTLPSDTDDARAHLVDAALACFERFGIDKTTMDDIAREAGVSRPMIYRFFADRDSLIMAVIASRARGILDAVRGHIETFSTFEDVLVEGLLLHIDLARGDPYVRLVVGPDQIGLATKVIGGSEAAVDLIAEVWEPVFLAAQERGELGPGRDRREMCRWLLYLQILFVGRRDLFPDDVDGHRRMLREFLLPAFQPSALAGRTAPLT